MGTSEASEAGPVSNPPSKVDRKETSVYVSEATRILAQTLAQSYSTSQAQTVRTALLLLEERRQEIDLIQVPELVAEVTDLEISVRALIGLGEQLEKLVIEAIESHATRPPGQA